MTTGMISTGILGIHGSMSTAPRKIENIIIIKEDAFFRSLPTLKANASSITRFVFD
ncbi:hypothetical protein [Slackia isoflavoniconvertens]|uniref:hypothetical protein n=1 Tax=Slackia isoflavoniconvertens TaxID=572010 RepID=UPI003AAD6682